MNVSPRSNSTGLLLIWIALIIAVQGGPVPYSGRDLVDQPDDQQDHPFIEERGRLSAIRGFFVRWPLADQPPGSRRYSASGLPPGLTISEFTGEISGTPKLAGTSTVVITARRDHPTDGMAFIRFYLTVTHPTDLDLAGESQTIPNVDVFRTAIAPGPIGLVPPTYNFTESSVRFIDALPTGLIWDAASQTLGGLPNEQGVYQLPYRIDTAVGSREGLVVVSAGDDRSARSLANSSLRLALLGDTLIQPSEGMVYRTELADLSPDGDVPSEESSAPWLESRVNALETGLGHFVALVGGGELFLSENGQEWTAADVSAGAERVFAAENSILVNGFNGSGTSEISTDGQTWETVSAEELGRTRLACHTGTEWVAITDELMVKASTNGRDWEDRGRMMWWRELLDSDLVWHGGHFYLVDKDLNDERDGSTNTYVSDDALHWRAIEGLAAPVRQLAVANGDLWAMTRSALYQMTAETDHFHLRWMAPAGSSLFRFAGGDEGYIALTTSRQSWLVSKTTLPPQLQGEEAFPSVDRGSVLAGEPFTYQWTSNDTKAQFKAYHLPDGVTLDRESGLMAGTLAGPGIYRAIVSPVVAEGEGIPRLYEWAVYPSGAKLEIDVFARDSFTGTPSKFLTYERGEILGDVFLEVPDRSRLGLVAKVQSLPPGIQFSSQTWAISGIASESGRFPLIIDLASPAGSTRIEIPVLVGDSTVGEVIHGGLSDAQVGTLTESRFGMRVADGLSGFKFFALGLPDGLSIHPTSGLISGRPLTAGLYRYAVGIERETGLVGKLARGLCEVQRRTAGPGGMAVPPPERRTTFQVLKDGPSATYELDYPDDVTVEFLSLPSGMSFVPPRSLSTEASLTEGIHVAKVRLTNETGFAENDLVLIAYGPEPLTQSIRLQEETTASLNASFRSTVIGAAEADQLFVLGLPDGLRFDEEERVVAGTPQMIGEWQIHFIALKADVVVAHSKQSIEVGPAAVIERPSYATAYEGYPWEWSSPQYNGIQRQVVARGLPISSDSELPGLSGTWRTPGRFELPLQFRETSVEAGAPIILHVYQPPAWEPERRRARYLPKRNLFDQAAVTVLERSTPFSLSVESRFTRDGQRWDTLRLPEEAPTVSFVDIAAGEELVLAGEDWWATGTSINRFVEAKRSFDVINAISTHGKLIVAATDSGLVSLNPDGPRFNGSGRRELHGVAIGNDRIIAVGIDGYVEVFLPNGDLVSVTQHASASLKDVLFSEGEFIAVGDHGAVLRSVDGSDWTFDRHPTVLGADFRHVTANRDWIVAVSPWMTLAGSRQEETWESVERVPVQDSYLDQLVRSDGSVLGGYSEGLYVPRRATASTTILSAPCQTVLLGQPFEYQIAALAEGDVSYRVEGLPDGLTLNAETGQIHGRISEAGYHELLIEASSDQSTHGKTLVIDVEPEFTELTETVVSVPTGTQRIVIPTTQVFHSVTHETDARIKGVDWRYHPSLSRSQAVEIEFDFNEFGRFEFPLRLLNPAGAFDQLVVVQVIGPELIFITQPPSLSVVTAGHPVELVTDLQGRWPISFQWYRDGQPVPEGTGMQLSTSLAGSYELRASNTLGDIVSQTSVVRIDDTVSGYANWAADRGLAPDSQFEDRDGNGQANILEYALVDVPQFRRTAEGFWEFEVNRRRDDDVLLSVQHSSDLQSWQTIPEASLTHDRNGDDSEFVRWIVDDSEGYLRILIE